MPVSSRSWDVLDFTEVLKPGEFAGMVVESASFLGSSFCGISLGYYMQMPVLRLSSLHYISPQTRLICRISSHSGDAIDT